MNNAFLINPIIINNIQMVVLSLEGSPPFIFEGLDSAKIIDYQPAESFRIKDQVRKFPLTL